MVPVLFQLKTRHGDRFEPFYSFADHFTSFFLSESGCRNYSNEGVLYLWKAKQRRYSFNYNHVRFHFNVLFSYQQYELEARKSSTLCFGKCFRTLRIFFSYLPLRAIVFAEVRTENFLLSILHLWSMKLATCWASSELRRFYFSQTEDFNMGQILVNMTDYLSI